MPKPAKDEPKRQAGVTSRAAKPRRPRRKNGPPSRRRRNTNHPDQELARIEGWQRHLRTGVLDAIVLVRAKSEALDRVVQAVEIINTAQTFYRLRLRLDRREELLGASGVVKSPENLSARLRRKFPSQLVLAIAERDLPGDMTIHEEPGCAIISCEDWGDDEAPTLRVYLVYQMVSALITFAGCLTEDENDTLLHKWGADEGDEATVPRGCLFDYWTDTDLLYLSMVSARLCDRCRSMLLAHGTPTAAIAATEKLLDWIRSVILGREVPLPRKIFLGHGRNKDWQQLRRMLREWNLEVDEFNEQPVAGMSVTQRLKSMLDQARFAFLVMTGEDEQKGGELAARMNVIHEIGLFQGRLGTEQAVVLRRTNTKLFSNLDGINRLEYEKNRLRDLRSEIHRLLTSRGVMPADTRP